MVTLETIAGTLETFGAKFDAIDGKFETFGAKFEAIDGKFDALDAKFDKKLYRLEESLTKKFDEKIDDLAAMTARGFSEVNERLEVIEENYVTKDDLEILSKNIDRKFDTHISIFRKDYDGLAKRTKNLEKAVFTS
jgi:hypothetical protein